MSFDGRPSVLALIPARAGSKRVPGKNLKSLGGKPLITWTIEAALKSQKIGATWVSSDSDDILAEARRAGAEVPFVRPSEYSTDTASSLEVVLHALDFARDRLQVDFQIVALLQPTSPLRNAEDIDAALDLISRKSADAVVSVCASDHNPLWMNVLPQDQSLEGFLRPEIKNKRSQDLPVYYRLNGAIYAIRTETLRKERSFLPERNSFAYVMPKIRSVDIDDPLDFLVASACLESQSHT